MLLSRFALLLSLFASTVLATPVNALAQPTDFNLPEIQRDTLANGLRILYARVNNVPMVEISFLIDAGVDCDPEGKSGLAQAVTQLLRTGTKERDKAMLDEFLSVLSTDVTSYTHFDYAQLYAKSLSRNFRSTFEVLANMVTHPTFPAGYLKELQNTVPAVTADRKLSQPEIASKLLLEQLCGTGNPSAVTLAEHLQGVHALTIEDVREFHARHYRPERTTVLVVGSIEYRFVRILAQELLGSWTPEPVASETLRSYPMRWNSEQISVIPDSATRIAQYRFGVPALARRDTRFFAQLVMNELFGGGADSRLHQFCWQDRKLSPNMSSSIGFSGDCAYLVVAGSAASRMADTVFSAVTTAMRTLRDGEFTQEEVARISERLVREYAYEFSNNAGVLGLLKELALHGRTGEEFSDFVTALRACTREEVQEVAREVLRPDRLRIVINGNAAELGEQLGEDRIVLSSGQ